MDVWLVGRTIQGAPLADLYLNGGAGQFTRTTLAAVVPLAHPRLAVGDLDNDGAPDLVLTGLAPTGPTTQVYFQVPGGQVTPGQTLAGVWGGDVVLGNMDADNDLDLIATGQTHPTDTSALATYFWPNNGGGNFVTGVNTGVLGMRQCQFQLADMDGNGSLDLMTAGTLANGDARAKLYLNSGGHLNDVHQMDFPHLYYPQFDIADIDGDGDLDLSFGGLDLTTNPSVPKGITEHHFYLNKGNGYLHQQPVMSLLAAADQAPLWVDLEGDGDLDFIPTTTNHLYINYGNDYYERMAPIITGLPLSFAQYGVLVASDVDGDGDQDLIIREQGPINNLYLNDGNNQFTLDKRLPLNPFAAQVADVDNDGDEDLFWALRLGRFLRPSVYLNDGSGNYTTGSWPILTDEIRALHSYHYTDLNGDGLRDWLFFTDRYATQAPERQFLYLGQSNGAFTLDSTYIDDSLQVLKSALADVDGDGDLDLAGLFYRPFPNYLYELQLWLNDGNARFSPSPVAQLVSASTYLEMAWLDADRDGDQDLLVTGDTAFSQTDAWLWINDGTGRFTRDGAAPFMGIVEATIRIGDVEGDGDQDVLISGTRDLFGPSYTTIYKNTILSIAVHPLPDPPAQNPESLIFPNPNQTGLLHLNYTAAQALDLQVQLLDLTGKLVDEQVFSITEGQHTLQFDIQNLPAGLYLVHLQDGTHQQTHQLVVPH